MRVAYVYDVATPEGEDCHTSTATTICRYVQALWVSPAVTCIGHEAGMCDILSCEPVGLPPVRRPRTKRRCGASCGDLATASCFDT